MNFGNGSRMTWATLEFVAATAFATPALLPPWIFAGGTMMMDSSIAKAKEAERLALDAVQALDPATRLDLAAQVAQYGTFSHEEGLFGRTEPQPGTQLQNLGATKPWPRILEQVATSSKNYRLILFVRHGQATENISPHGGNIYCNFTANGSYLPPPPTGICSSPGCTQIWDSALTETGIEQAMNVRKFLSGVSPYNSSWRDPSATCASSQGRPQLTFVRCNI